MNIDKYKKIRLYLVMLGIIFMPIVLFIPRKKNRIIFSSTSNLRYNYNSKYLFEYFLEKYPKLEIKYVLNDKKLRKKLEKEIGNYFIDTLSLKNIIYCLRGSVWITSSLETPIGGIFLNYNRLVIHLGHGVPLKNIGLMEKNISLLKKIYYRLIKYNFTYFLSTSNNFVAIWSKFLNISRDKIFINGQPRNDSIFIKKNKFLESNFGIQEREINILYAPTWRQWGETLLFPFEDFESRKLESFLLENKINIFIRVHPSFESKIESKFSKIKKVHIFDSKVAEDITEYLSCFDILITDYSSIFIDFLLLDRPIIFLPYDYKEYYEKIGFTIDYQNYTPGEKIYNFEVFLQELKKLLNGNDTYRKNRKKLNNFYNYCKTKENCRLLSEFILKKLGEKNEKSNNLWNF